LWALRFLAWLIALGALGLGLGSLGGVESTRLDLLTHMTPATFLAAALSLALWAMAGRKGRALPIIGALALFIPGALMAPEVYQAIRPRPSIPANAERLTVLQFNLWSSNPDPQKAAAFILAMDPDVVLLQEAQEDAVPVITALSERYPYTVSCYWGYACDARVMLKRPFTAKSRENPGPAGTEATNIGQVAWVRTTTPGGYPFTIASMHLGWPPPLGNQAFERDRFLRELKTLPKEGLILAGDYNSTPWSFAMRRQDRAFMLERRTRAVFSWPATFPVAPIDHLYAAAQWRTVSVRRGPRLGSDHRPILTTLALVR